MYKLFILSILVFPILVNGYAAPKSPSCIGFYEQASKNFISWSGQTYEYGDINTYLVVWDLRKTDVLCVGITTDTLFTCPAINQYNSMRTYGIGILSVAYLNNGAHISSLTWQLYRFGSIDKDPKHITKNTYTPKEIRQIVYEHLEAKNNFWLAVCLPIGLFTLLIIIVIISIAIYCKCRKKNGYTEI